MELVRKTAGIYGQKSVELCEGIFLFYASSERVSAVNLPIVRRLSDRRVFRS